MSSSTVTPPGHSTPTPDTAAVASKYAKLSSEYAKLRAQFGVVKKAVIEEQSKNGELSDRAREAAVEKRKLEQEMEALHFRNQQLTKRIEVLQDEMDKTTEVGGKGGKSGSRKLSVGRDADAVQNSESLNSVIGQELSAKIEENERLHERLSTVDVSYGEVIERLNSRIREVEAEVRRRSQDDRAGDSKQKDLISGLKTENVGLLRRVGELERDLIDHQDRITVLQVQLETKGASTSAAVAPPPGKGISSPARSGDDTATSKFLPLTSPAPDSKETDSEKEVMAEELLQAKEEKVEIAKFLDELNEKVRRVEQAKEHWKLEYQLLQMKYDKLRSENGVAVVAGEEEEGELFRRPFAERIEEMVSERLHADSRASAFRLECVSLQRRIRYD